MPHFNTFMKNQISIKEIASAVVFFLILVFPTKSFEVRYLFELGLLFLLIPMLSIQRKHLNIILIIVSYMIISSLIRIYSTGDIYEFSDTIRIITPIIVLFFLIEYLSLQRLIQVIFYIAIFNALVLIYQINGKSVSFLDAYVYSTASEFTYGRNQGLFSNIAITGILSSFFMITTYLALLEGYGKKNINITTIFFSIFGLIFSQSRTSIIIGLFLLILISMFYFSFFQKRKLLALFVMAILTSVPIIFFSTILNNFYIFSELFNAQSVWNVSSMVIRFEYWKEFLSLSFESVFSFLFGVEKSLSSSVGNTFDNDYIWLLIKYGVVGLASYLIFLFYACIKLFKYNTLTIEGKIACWLSIFILFSSLLLGILSTPVLLAYLIFFYGKKSSLKKI